MMFEPVCYNPVIRRVHGVDRIICHLSPDSADWYEDRYILMGAEVVTACLIGVLFKSPVLCLSAVQRAFWRGVAR